MLQAAQGHAVATRSVLVGAEGGVPRGDGPTAHVVPAVRVRFGSGHEVGAAAQVLRSRVVRVPFPGGQGAEAIPVGTGVGVPVGGGGQIGARVVVQRTVVGEVHPGFQRIPFGCGGHMPSRRADSLTVEGGVSAPLVVVHGGRQCHRTGPVVKPTVGGAVGGGVVVAPTVSGGIAGEVHVLGHPGLGAQRDVPVPLTVPVVAEVLGGIEFLLAGHEGHVHEDGDGVLEQTVRDLDPERVALSHGVIQRSRHPEDALGIDAEGRSGIAGNDRPIQGVPVGIDCLERVQHGPGRGILRHPQCFRWGEDRGRTVHGHHRDAHAGGVAEAPGVEQLHREEVLGLGPEVQRTVDDDSRTIGGEGAQGVAAHHRPPQTRGVAGGPQGSHRGSRLAVFRDGECRVVGRRRVSVHDGQRVGTDCTCVRAGDGQGV